ncbi:hypothetical protein KC19_6G168600 [Ceratodon purpureus]|uniref:Uncharacterized protein n=1 Tax=Ceratodon purpureus TaxID=3225 RepID=A0A8T0HGP3_CERPU|nr:hypothetical protein KC19_6G168600 [Ceratodon purpureus]
MVFGRRDASPAQRARYACPRHACAATPAPRSPGARRAIPARPDGASDGTRTAPALPGAARSGGRRERAHARARARALPTCPRPAHARRQAPALGSTRIPPAGLPPALRSRRASLMSHSPRDASLTFFLPLSRSRSRPARGPLASPAPPFACVSSSSSLIVTRRHSSPLVARRTYCVARSRRSGVFFFFPEGGDRRRVAARRQGFRRV